MNLSKSGIRIINGKFYSKKKCTQQQIKKNNKSGLPFRHPSEKVLDL